MDTSTPTTERPRWVIEEYDPEDAAPSAFPMPDGEVGDTTCTGGDSRSDTSSTDDVFLPQADDPFAGLPEPAVEDDDDGA